MKNREFVMLAENFPAENSPHLGLWMMSEKMDGIRALWMPETRGVPISQLDFANVDRKTAIGAGRRATGLWSRYANIIEAPPWWLDRLPPFPLDGELYLGQPGKFQELTSIVKAWKSPRDWEPVKYYVFDTPSYQQVFYPGKINNPNYKKIILAEPRQLTGVHNLLYSERFERRYKNLLNANVSNDVVDIHQQHMLPMNNDKAMQSLFEYMDKVKSYGGEGLIVRYSQADWLPYRVRSMLKLKVQNDAEGVVVGYNPGTGRLLGMTGSVRVKMPSGKTFDLSGFTDSERRNAVSLFPVGSVLTYKYRELTDEGLPKEARYFRKRAEV